jgi:hypothetical protein
VESSCELGNESSGSIKCWELSSCCTTCGLSSGTQLHRVSSLVSKEEYIVPETSYVRRMWGNCIAPIVITHIILQILKRQR